MEQDGFSYPIREEQCYWNPNKKTYVYVCHICNREIGNYQQCRVKGNITCCYCRSRIAKEKRDKLKVEMWQQSICEN